MMGGVWCYDEMRGRGCVPGPGVVCACDRSARLRLGEGSTTKQDVADGWQHRPLPCPFYHCVIVLPLPLQVVDDSTSTHDAVGLLLLLLTPCLRTPLPAHFTPPQVVDDSTNNKMPLLVDGSTVLCLVPLITVSLFHRCPCRWLTTALPTRCCWSWITWRAGRS